MINFLLKNIIKRPVKGRRSLRALVAFNGTTSNGMTYVELIVVLSIFAVLSSVAIFNYGSFQAKVDIKNLANDIALKFVQAQRSSLNGLWNSSAAVDWKPSYGVLFDTTTPASQKQFIYFADLNSNGAYDISSSELLNTINITKNNYISKIEKCSNTACTLPFPSVTITSIATTFRRPDSGAQFLSSPLSSLPFTGSDYVRITIMSPKGLTAFVKLYPSGRVQIN